MKTKKAIDQNKDLIVAGASIGALAVAAYFLTGPKGKANQKKMKGWMVRMKGEVIDRLEDVKDVTEPVYHDVVDTVAHAQLLNDRIPRREIMLLAEDLKQDWKTITKLAKGGSSKKKSVSTAKKTSKKSTAKSAKKSR